MMDECSTTDLSSTFDLNQPRGMNSDLSEKMKTQEFLAAAADAVSIIGKFGKVFTPVTSDMSNNIQKLTTKYEEDPEAHMYLEDMILKERSFGREVATDALLWLRRGLHFLSYFYRLIIRDNSNHPPKNDLAPFLKQAYEYTLRPYHGWLGTQLFNVLSRFTPTRKQLLLALAEDQPGQEENVIKDMERYNQELNACVQRLIEFYETYSLYPPSNI